VQLRNDHSISMVPLSRHHDENSVRYRWKVPEQKIGDFLLGAKSSANSNKESGAPPEGGSHWDSTFCPSQNRTLYMPPGREAGFRNTAPVEMESPVAYRM
jgi:hypothetical protein